MNPHLDTETAGARRRRTRDRRAAALAALTMFALVAATFTIPTSTAGFQDTTSNSANTLAGATLAPPSGFSVTQSCAGGYWVTISHVGSTSDIRQDGRLVFTKPTGTAADDVMVAQLVVRAEGTTPTAPAGWTLLDTQGPSGGGATQFIWFKVAGGSEPASYTFDANPPPETRTAGGLAVYRGVDTTTPIDASAGASGSSGNAVAPSVNASVPGVRLFVAFGERGSTLPGTDPAMNARWRVDSGGGSTGVGASGADQALVAAGATGTRTTAAGSTWMATTVALRPIRVRGTPSASLTWTPSPTSAATGYQVERYVGATLQATTTVTPIGATGTTIGPLANSVTYTFRIYSYLQSWTSTWISENLSTNCP